MNTENMPAELSRLQEVVESAFASGALEGEEIKPAVQRVIELLDSGVVRVAQRGDNGEWLVNQWVKMAVLLSFRLTPSRRFAGGAGESYWWDKVEAKTHRWQSEDFESAGFRFVPGALVRRGAFVDSEAVLMPSFVNIGARVGKRTMIDTWATVGSCAQIGQDVHISGGTGIGGVLEPIGNRPVIIEDNVFVGARSEVAEGVIVREGSVLAMGCFIGASTKIVERDSGKIHIGEVPPYSVVVPASLPAAPRHDGTAAPSLACVAIVKQVDERTRAKTSINDLLR